MFHNPAQQREPEDPAILDVDAWQRIMPELMEEWGCDDGFREFCRQVDFICYEDDKITLQLVGEDWPVHQPAYHVAFKRALGSMFGLEAKRITIRPYRMRIVRDGAGHASTKSTPAVGRKRQFSLDAIEPEDLDDHRAVGQYYLEAVRRGYLKPVDEDVLLTFALARRALRKDKRKTPGKLFHHMLRDPQARGKWFTGKMEDDVRSNRALSDLRYELVDKALTIEKSVAKAPVVSAERSAAVFGAEGPAMGIVHAVLAQTFMPQRALPHGQDHWISKHGDVTLMVRAGMAPDLGDDATRVHRMAVPSGSPTRLILPHIMGYALYYDTRDVHLGGSLRLFLNALKIPVGGRTATTVGGETINLAFAQITLGQFSDTEGGRTATVRTVQIATEIEFWQSTGHIRETELYTPHMRLSRAFFESVKERPVPVRLEHLVALSPRARCMDLYIWACYRTHRLNRGGRVSVPLDALRPIFAPHQKATGRLRDWRRTLKRDFQRIYEVDQSFHVEFKGDILRLIKGEKPAVESKRAVGRRLVRT